MLYKFKSKNAGDVIMLESNGRKLLEVIGKDPGPTGIILAAQMPAAIAALQAAIVLEESIRKAADAEAKANAKADAEIEANVDRGTSADTLGLRQRAMPFIDMLERNHSAQTDVVWGV